MTQYAVAADALGQFTFKVEYADPAGGFGGWFLHSIWFSGAASAGFSNPATDPAGASGSLEDGESASGAALHASIRQRLTQMFGNTGSVTYAVRLVQGITPAVIDLEY